MPSAQIASAMGDMNPRFKGENILNLELDMPEVRGERGDKARHKHIALYI